MRGACRQQCLRVRSRQVHIVYIFRRWGTEQPLPVQDGDRDFGRPGSILLAKEADRPGVYRVYAEVGRAVLHISCHLSLSLSLSLSLLSPSPLSVCLCLCLCLGLCRSLSVSVCLYLCLCLSLSLSSLSLCLCLGLLCICLRCLCLSLSLCLFLSLSLPLSLSLFLRLCGAYVARLGAMFPISES